MFRKRTESPGEQVLAGALIDFRVRNSGTAALLIKAAEKAGIEQSRHPFIWLDDPLEVCPYDEIPPASGDLLFEHCPVDWAAVLAASATATAACL
jgi:hypothetical protein